MTDESILFLLLQDPWPPVTLDITATLDLRIAWMTRNGMRELIEQIPPKDLMLIVLRADQTRIVDCLRIL